ncbi:relaxase/mobilization nuclease domain-containing protein [Paracoccus jeotgali]|uniref:relaxase/mobilization nuclease domain-containing protein n=1 Tax=Paracoccus jeotgali TaxID=2065379 RepID=UPI0028AA7B53|nr:hypothetical protein [Paracoccus jeotgali]
MTRPFLSFMSDLEAILRYLARLRSLDASPPQADLVAGTIPWLGLRPTMSFIRTLQKPADVKKNLILITVSLPDGRTLSRRQWRQALKTVFLSLGLPEHQVPWLAFRHHDSRCEHVHILAIAMTFAGRRLPLTALKQRCDAADLWLCRDLGIAPPDYHLAGMGPRMGIFVPARRIAASDALEKDRFRKTVAEMTAQRAAATALNAPIAKAVREVLLTCQPENPESLAAALRQRDPAITVTREPVPGQPDDWIFAQAGRRIKGWQLSPEFIDSPMQQRFIRAGQLRRLREALDLHRLLVALETGRTSLTTTCKEIIHGKSTPDLDHWRDGAQTADDAEWQRGTRHGGPQHRDARPDPGAAAARPVDRPAVGDPGDLVRDPRDIAAADVAAGSAGAPAGPVDGTGPAAGRVAEPAGLQRERDRASGEGPARGDQEHYGRAGRADKGRHAAAGWAEEARDHPQPPGPEAGAAHPRPVRGRASLGEQLSRVRAVLRWTGLQARPRLRRRDRSIAVHFADGSAARVRTDEVILEQAAAAQSGMARLFAKGWARFCNWLDNTDGSAWPFPAPQRRGMPLAATAAALRRQIAARLRRAELICLHDNAERPQTMQKMLHAEFGLPAPLASKAPRQPHVLVLTPDCVAELASDPAWYLDRLRDWQAALPDLGVITLAPDSGAPQFGNIAGLVEEIEAAGRHAEAEPEDPEEAPAPNW